MTPIAVNTTPTVCPQCGGALSLPYGSRTKPGMVVQTCRNYQHCGESVWSEAPATPPVIAEDLTRHGRMFLPSTSEPMPPKVIAPNRWKRFSDSELVTVNQQDRKRAAAGGER